MNNIGTVLMATVTGLRTIFAKRAQGSDLLPGNEFSAEFRFGPRLSIIDDFREALSRAKDYTLCALASVSNSVIETA